MNLTKLTLRRPVSVFVVMLGLVIFGIISIFTAPMELLPEMNLPMSVIITTYPNAGPESVEEQVTKVIETACSTVSGVKTVNSTSSENMSTVFLEFNYGTNMDNTYLDLVDKLNRYSGTLPEDAQEPIILQMTMDMIPVIVLSAKETGDVDLVRYMEDEVRPEFEKLSGVAQVEITGGQRDYISVQLDADKLRQYGLDITTLAAVVGGADFSMPAGSVERGNLDLKLRGGASYPSTESLRSIPITTSSGKTIYLSDVAYIHETTSKATSINRTDGLDNVGVSITKRQTASTVDVARDVISAMEKINDANMGIQMDVVYDSSKDVIGGIETVLSTLALGVLLSMAVLLLFFGDWKSSLIVGASMPISVLAAIILMNLFGFSFNVLSLGGLVIGVGMLVDNSIVVVESCYRRLDQQRTYAQAALEGTKIVTESILGGTLTTVVVYLPISFMQGLSGQLFRQLGLTIIFSLSMSFASAVTIVPLLFMRVKPVEKKSLPINRLLASVERWYGGFLQKTFRRKWLVVLTSVVLLLASLGMAFSGLIPTELIPNVDQGQISFAVLTKPGLKLSETNKLLQQLESIVKDVPDVETYSLSGTGGSATLSVYLKKDRVQETRYYVEQWQNATKSMVDADVTVNSVSTADFMGGGAMGMGGGGAVQVPLQGNDYDALKKAAEDIEALLRNRTDMIRVTNNATAGNPQAEVVVDPVKAAARGLTPAQVVGTMYTMLNGSTPASLRQNGQEYDIKLEFPEGRFKTVEDLTGMMLSTPYGMQVPLMDIATLTYTNAPQSINRLNNQYVVTVTAQPELRAEEGAEKSVLDQIAAEYTLPHGVEITKSATMESMTEEFTSLGIAIAVAVLLVFMVMAMQFESMRFSLIVMICIPFSLIGSFFLLLVTRTSISMPSLLGFLTLVGTVINNGILFIDTANQYRSSMDAQTALICAGRIRLRPILMTTLTTVLALIPMALGIGESGALLQGMSLVIMGGLMASTILCMLLLPTFYLLMGGGKPKIDPFADEASNLLAAKELTIDEMMHM